MRYLLDGNALIAVGVKGHQHHARVAAWALSQGGGDFLTCSITEIGFTRVVAQVPSYGLDLRQARALLLGMKSNPALKFNFISDTNDIAKLPSWVTSAGQITEGHLLQQAKSSGAHLATLGRGIPSAFLIP